MTVCISEGILGVVALAIVGSGWWLKEASNRWWNSNSSGTGVTGTGQTGEGTQAQSQTVTIHTHLPARSKVKQGETSVVIPADGTDSEGSHSREQVPDLRLVPSGVPSSVLEVHAVQQAWTHGTPRDLPKVEKDASLVLTFEEGEEVEQDPQHSHRSSQDHQSRSEENPPSLDQSD